MTTRPSCLWHHNWWLNHDITMSGVPDGISLTRFTNETSWFSDLCCLFFMKYSHGEITWKYGKTANNTLSCFWFIPSTWWRHQMETFSVLLALCVWNSPVTCEFPTQRPVTRSFDVFFDLCVNQRLSKQSLGWWFETPLCPLLRHCNGYFRGWVAELAPEPQQSIPFQFLLW